MYQNRKARRDFAKLAKMHRIKQNAPLHEQFEMTAAAIKAGKQLHAKFVEDSDNRQVKATKAKNDKIVKDLIKSGKSKKEANQFIQHNMEVAQNRKERLWARENRRAKEAKEALETK